MTQMNPLPAPIPQSTIDRAFAIADEAMIELLRSECISGGDTLYYPVAENGSVVLKLADASAAIREAFEWLEPRGLASLHEDAQGEFILIGEN